MIEVLPATVTPVAAVPPKLNVAPDTKFVPVIFGSQDKNFVPEPLSDQFYCLDSEDCYQELFSLLTGQAGVPRSELGAVKEFPRKDVEPLTFGEQSDKSLITGKLPNRPPPRPALGTDLTPGRNKGLPSNRDSSNQELWKEIVLYAVISLISFLCGMGILGLLIWNANLLASLGLTGNLYYLVLLPMGLAAAGFLFGVVRSYARYSGKQLGGMLELGGPIVAFLLVVILGFVLVKPVTTFPLTVYVHGKDGPQDLVLRNSGDVLLDLGLDRRRQPIGSEGQAYFPAIPATVRGQEVAIGVQSDGFEVNDPNRKYRLDGGSVYLLVRKSAGRISGRVQDENGSPLSGTKIEVAGLSATTDSAGHFEFVIPGERLQADLELEAFAAGYAPKHYKVVPNANEVVVQLTRAP